MEYNVINGEISVSSIDIFSLGGSSSFMVGDIKTISLSSAYETPPENLIVGVTIPLAPPTETIEE
ncbi:MAG TPA: spore gernimation protein GerPD [Paenibacillus sp.]|uniref:spore gernimation protein GerPD n=1 Tax=Paenibacillus sp. TaxID=58172 RepID=UPI0028D2BDC8|nr:spore gernimation protein GerPD [Paenibacillus sp.]HUC92229.1 spore gernimation protein GerPD [Paenibacillus sp.]